MAPHLLKRLQPLLFSPTTHYYQPVFCSESMFNVRLLLTSALALLAITTTTVADSPNGPIPRPAVGEFQERQIDSLVNSLTQDAGSFYSSLTNDASSIYNSLTNDVASGWNGGTSFLGSLGDGVYGTLTSIGGSVYTILSSEGGNAVTLAGNLPGVVTSFAGEQITILTSVAGGGPTNTGNGNAALPRSSFTLMDVGLALGGVALGALITFT